MDEEVLKEKYKNLYEQLQRIKGKLYSTKESYHECYNTISKNISIDNEVYCYKQLSKSENMVNKVYHELTGSLLPIIRNKM